MFRGIAQEVSTTPVSMSGNEGETPSPQVDTRRPAGLSDGPNARSKSITTAEGLETYGVSISSLCRSLSQANFIDAQSSSCSTI